MYIIKISKIILQVIWNQLGNKAWVSKNKNLSKKTAIKLSEQRHVDIVMGHSWFQKTALKNLGGQGPQIH